MPYGITSDTCHSTQVTEHSPNTQQCKPHILWTCIV